MSFRTGETSTTWASLSDEMGLAPSLLAGTIGALGLHVQKENLQAVKFDVRLDPGR
jgi:hypothetical protein